MIKFINIFFVAALFFFIVIPSFSESLDEYLIGCEKCFKLQKLLLTVPGIFSIEEKAPCEANTYEECQHCLDLFYKRGYIKEPINLEELNGCCYRFDTRELCCIKHGSLEYLESYKYYKKKFDGLNKENMIFSLIGIGLLLFALITKPGKKKA